MELVLIIKRNGGNFGYKGITMQINKQTIDDITILKVVVGSTAYGFATAQSDIDIKGVAIVPDLGYYYGFNKHFEQYEEKEPNDLTIYDIRKFFQLARAVNPSIIEMLYIDKPEHVLKITDAGKDLKFIRDQFLSMKVRHTYSGYSFAQLKKIKSHRAWLLNPPDHYPTREEFGLDSKEAIPFQKLQAMNKLINDGELKDINIQQYVTKENNYRNACQHYKQYEEWKRTRNPKRAELEAKYGYDCKSAVHLVRLMKQGLEIMETGKVIVDRPDAQELLGIRNGEWSYDRLIGFADEMDAKMAELYEHPEKCAVPYQPDEEELNKICTAIVDDEMNRREMDRIRWIQKNFKEIDSK